MKPVLSAIYYYPIKGLPGIALDECVLSRGERLPMDRRYALAPPDLAFDASQPRHVRKQELYVLMREERLAELSLDFNPASQHLRLTHRDELKVDAPLNTLDGQSALASTVSSLLDKPVKVLSAEGHGFTDLSDRCVSVINLASVRELEKALGTTIDKRRFRANLYVDALPAWSEFEWLNSSISINGVALDVYRITDRCAAINVDPGSARRDRLLQELRQTRGNLDMGVYARIANNGSIAAGDALTLPV